MFDLSSFMASWGRGAPPCEPSGVQSRIQRRREIRLSAFTFTSTLASAVGFIVSTLVICAVTVAYALSSAGIEAPDDIPMGISEALNCLAFSVV
jgi:hypothetical protein